jgi:uncharacterized membrane protein YdjX (TVP38/TMEM64 family)
VEPNLKRKHFIVWVLISGVFAAYIWFDVATFLNIEYVKIRYQDLELFEAENPFLSASLFFFLYVSVAALSIPGVLLMTLLSGAVFGFFKGFFF